MSKLDDLRIDAPVPKPRRRRRIPWVPLITFVFIVAVLVYFQRDHLAGLLPQGGLSPQPAATESADAAAAATPAAVPAGPAGSISAAGYLEVPPPGPLVVSALVPGKVAELLVIPGQQVTAGQLIARLDSSLLRQDAARIAPRVELARRELERQQAGFRSEEIDQAEAGLAAAESRLALAQANLDRSRELYEQGVIARQAYEEREAEVRQAEAAVAEASANRELYVAGTRPEDIEIAAARLSAAQAELASVQWEIGQCAIFAPAGGVVLEQYAHPGGWLSPTRDDPYGAAVVSIFDPANLQAWVDVNQRDSAALYVGQQVELTTDAEPGRKITGTVSRIMPQANLQKNTVQVKIAIPAPPPDFRPELSVKVVFLPQEQAAAPPEQSPPAEEESSVS